MTTRDSRLPPPAPPSGRDPTQSLQVDSESGASHPSLAVGTTEAAKDERTRIESPSGRNKPAVPAAAVERPHKPPPVPERNPDEAQAHIGNVLGTYRLVELLGKGGMGYVYRAEHTKLGREVALKLLRADYARRRDAVLRFFQEAKTVNRVRHRNIVDVTDFVELDDGTTFIIMEFLRGQSLGKWARSGIELPRALAVLVQICDGLGAAHAVGVIHRDLKPDNVIVVPTSDGAEMVKLLDFGVAKLLNRDDEDIGFQTAAGSVIGTPAYMSPEQAGGMAIDHRSDIYSLGAIMYELFCGMPMFRGRSFGEYVRKHLTEMPVPPRQTEHGANIDPRLEALILKCLTKDPNERFSHILELRDGLLHMLGALETSTPPTYERLSGSGVRPVPIQLPTTQLPPHMLPLPAPMVTTAPTPNPSASSQAHPSQGAYSTQSTLDPRTPWWLWFLGGAAAVGAGIVGAVWYAGRDAGGEVPPASPPTVTAPATPTAEPPGEPAAQPAQLVELRFDSLPKAGVFAEGHSAELCRTPCSFDVNVADGGPQDRRRFVVHADGYKNRTVEVDLTSAQRDYSVTLDQLEPAPLPPPQTGGPTSAETSEPGTKTSRTKNKVTRVKKSAETPDKTADKPADKADRPPDRDKGDEQDKPPEVKKPDPAPRSGKIDQTETLDPFHRHTP
jgi:serine/threonine-protein kinase